MPWREYSVTQERLRFVARLLEGEAMSEVCREFGISRKTGCKIFNRYRDQGLDALSDRSRRPARSPCGARPSSTSPHHGPMMGCPNSNTPGTIAIPWSPLAAASACTGKRSISRPCSPVRNSASRKSTTAFGSSASATMILAISTWSREPYRLSTNRSARDYHPCLNCHPCLRYVPLPMSPGRTNF